MFAGLSAGLLAAAAPATQPSSPIPARAHRVLATLRTTTYQHVTDIDEATGEYNCDCSGLVSWLLRKELPAHYKAVSFPAKYKHPRAVEFRDAFAAAPADPKPGDLWQRVDRLPDARPGDIWAWRKDPLPETGVTGHIVLFDSVPKQVADGVYEVVVIDSTSRPHHDDTRKPDQTGVGRGTMYFKTDADGRPVAYAGRSPDGPFSRQPMSIGRPVATR
jgi:hypothetical protein